MKEIPNKESETPVFPQTMHRVRMHGATEPTPSPKAEKRDNVQSRDLREDRGERQMKTTHNPQTSDAGELGVSRSYNHANRTLPDHSGASRGHSCEG